MSERLAEPTLATSTMHLRSDEPVGPRKRVAYVMSRFPHLPETFILREMNELERQGWEVVLYPLIRQKQAVVQPAAQPWLDRVQALPFLSAGVIFQNLRQWVRSPLCTTQLWVRTITGNLPSRKFLLRAVALLPKAVYAARRMQADKVEHIHAHYATHPALFAWLVNRLTGIPYSVTVHAHDIFVDTTMLGPKLADAAFIVAISEFNRQYLSRLLGPWVEEKTHVVHCGVDTRRYPLRRAARQEGERLEIIHVGSLQPYKGQAVLIAALKSLQQRDIPFYCRIIGGGELQDNLQSQITAAGLDRSVELMGSRTEEEIAELLANAHVYVQPSIVTANGKMEGIPVAIMEAFACGLPVVATRLSGVPELVRAGETGYLVAPNEPGELARALETVYNNPQEAAQLGENGRQLVLEQFELETNVRELGHLLAAVRMD